MYNTNRKWWGEKWRKNKLTRMYISNETVHDSSQPFFTWDKSPKEEMHYHIRGQYHISSYSISITEWTHSFIGFALWLSICIYAQSEL